MNARNTSIVALLTLALGGAGGYLKFVQPALAENTRLKQQNTDLNNQSTQLAAQVADLRNRVNNMAMSTISYFDLTGVSNKRRIMEAKTVETLASLTSILDDNHVKIIALDPKGETTGLNKPVPTPPPASAKPGESAAPTPPPAATPTPQPGATTPPPPIQLTHKVFSFDLQGEYPDLVKALREIQGLPRAISIADFKVDLVDAETGKVTSQHRKAASFSMKVSPSLLEMTFDLSITFLMDTGGNVTPVTPAPAGSPGHAEGFLADVEDWWCPPAMAEELAQDPFAVHHWSTREVAARHPGLAVFRPLVPKVAPVQPRHAGRAKVARHGANAIEDVVWTGDAIALRTKLGSSPAYRIVGHRPGLLVLELRNTVSSRAAFFHPHGPGVKQIMTLPAPHDPHATHLAITADPATHLRVGTSLDRQLRIFVEGPHVALAPVSHRPPQAAAGAAPRPAHPVGTAQAVKEPRTVLALLPAHAAATFGPPAPANHPTHATAPAAPQPADAGMAPPALEVVVKAHANARAAALESTTDSVAPATEHAWQSQELHELVDASAPLHEVPTPAPITVVAPQMADATSGEAADSSTAGTAAGGSDVAQPVVDLPVEQPAVAPAAKLHVLDASERDRLDHQVAARVTRTEPGTNAREARRPPSPGKAAPPAPKETRVALVPGNDAAPHAPHRSIFAPPPGAVVRPARAHHAAHVTPGPQDLTHLDGARVEDGCLVIATHGAPASFHVLGGNKHLLLLSVDHLRLPGVGQRLDVGADGIKEIRAALYDNRTFTSHLAIDTDGSVRLTPEAGDDGTIRLRIAGGHVRSAVRLGGETVTADLATDAISNTQDGVPEARRAIPRPTPKAVVHHEAPHTRVVKLAPVVIRHLHARAAVKAHRAAPARRAAVASRPHVVPVAPGATPTPMAIPHGGATQPVHVSTLPAHTPAPTPGGEATPVPEPTPTPTPVIFEGRHLEGRSSISSYHFPIDRDRLTGRANPFKPLTNPMAHLMSPPPPPQPGVGGDGIPVVPERPKGMVGPPVSYTVKAIMLGAGYPPTALISANGKSLLVGLNQGLPGNATVKSIGPDYVILAVDGRTRRLNLPR